MGLLLLFLASGCAPEDADGDGYSKDDCDDGDPAIHPGATEACNGVDDDCDGEGDTYVDWYDDADGDGYGDDATVVSDCDQPEGSVTLGGDCDDTDADINPGADEPDCWDPVDYNCDGTVVYADADGDGFAACLDCDDNNEIVFPGQAEACNGFDDDCDDLIDDMDPDNDPRSVLTWFEDADGDGYGGEEVEQACLPPEGYISISGDCNDADPAISPAAAEICNGADEDCDDLIDDEDPTLTEGTVWYHDRDADGAGGEDTRHFCTTIPESGYTAAYGDCDDTDPTIQEGCVEPTFAESYDVVVVGSGPAGIAAGFAAGEMGASVLILDKAPSPGIGILAGSGAFGAGTRWQADAGVSDSVEQATADWESITGVSGYQTSVQNYLAAVPELLEWLESYGMEVVDVLERDDTGPVARTHIWSSMDLVTYDPVLIESYPDEIRTEIEVTGPVMWEGQVVGVRYTDLTTGATGTIGAGAVILATGGFQRDEDILHEQLPEIDGRDWVWECILQSDAGGETFADLVGAAYINRENIGTYFHSIQDPYGDEHEALLYLDASRGIYVGTDGNRFADETTVSSFGFLGQAPEGEVFAIIDGDIADGSSAERPFYNWASTDSESFLIRDLVGVSTDVYTGSTLMELAGATGIDAAALIQSVEDYNDAVAAGGVDAFGRDVGGSEPIDEGDLVAIRMYVGVAKTFGGIQTDLDTSVLGEDGLAIPGLYAAGEGVGYLPGGGSGAGWGGAVSAAYYGGRLAGETAATFATGP